MNSSSSTSLSSFFLALLTSIFLLLLPPFLPFTDETAETDVDGLVDALWLLLPPPQSLSSSLSSDERSAFEMDFERDFESDLADSLNDFGVFDPDLCLISIEPPSIRSPA